MVGTDGKTKTVYKIFHELASFKKRNNQSANIKDCKVLPRHIRLKLWAKIFIAKGKRNE